MLVHRVIQSFGVALPSLSKMLREKQSSETRAASRFFVAMSDSELVMAFTAVA